MEQKLKVIFGKEKQFSELRQSGNQISLRLFSKLLKIPFSYSKVASLELSRDAILKSIQVWVRKRELSFVRLFLVC